MADVWREIQRQVTAKLKATHEAKGSAARKPLMLEAQDLIAKAIAADPKAANPPGK